MLIFLDQPAIGLLVHPLGFFWKFIHRASRATKLSVKRLRSILEEIEAARKQS
jgi:hypothetical protein